MLKLFINSHSNIMVMGLYISWSEIFLQRGNCQVILHIHWMAYINPKTLYNNPCAVCLPAVMLTGAPFIKMDQLLITAWIRNHMPMKVGDEISYPFQNVNSFTIEIWELIDNFIFHFMKDKIAYLCWDLSWTVLLKVTCVVNCNFCQSFWW